MQRYTIYFYLETAVPVSAGGTFTHHQERKQLCFAHSNQFQLLDDSGR